MLSFSFTFPKLLAGTRGRAIDIHSVKIHEIETAQEKPARALKHLLRLNHANNAILFNERRFHNHTPHVRTTVYSR